VNCKQGMTTMLKATIVYDNTSIRSDLLADWGFSCLIETERKTILFDTGANGKILMANMKALHIDPKTIDEVFISHNHFDHTGGLSAFLNANPNVTVYVPKDLRGIRQAKEVVYIDQAQALSDGFYSTGVLDNIEQSLAVQTNKGLVLFVGCSHPAMDKILNAARQFGTLHGIIGGLHGFDQYELFRNLQLICPTHCTQHKAGLTRLYADKIVPGGAGTVIEID